MDGFDFSQVRHQLTVLGLRAKAGPDNTLTLVPQSDGAKRADLLTTWGIDNQGHLYCDLTQLVDGPGSFDLLAALATNTRCGPGDETHVASLIANLMQTKVVALAHAHPVLTPALALSA
jgi:hypothetical protein